MLLLYSKNSHSEVAYEIYSQNYLFLFCLIFFIWLWGKLHNHKIKKASAGVESLSPELCELLTKEMLAIQNGMMSVIPAYAAGDWAEIERIAYEIKSSYILKQSLYLNHSSN